MVTHYIVMSSSYTLGKRIALDYLINKNVDFEKLNIIVNKITKECGKDVSISTHFIQTDFDSWKSVCEKDHFFKDVKVISNIEKFIELIQQDRIIIGLDVAKYILCKVSCTHLKLEKLVYLCFADYLCKFNKELYKDDIYAYMYGPVVRSVYEKYKRYGYREIEEDSKKLLPDRHYVMSARSRILFAESGIEKINSIDETIRKYGDLSALDLVKLTHRDGTPWALSGRGKIRNEIISNDIIKEYHHIEEYDI